MVKLFRKLHILRSEWRDSCLAGAVTLSNILYF